LEWLASSYNSDETAENTFLTGHVQASDSGQGTETQVIAVRPDKTLEEIGQLHQELQSAARVFLIQQMHEYGVPEEDIARRFEVPLDRVREILRIELSDESVSEDIRRYLGGEFYYANSESDEAGFFILTVPRKSAVILHVLKDGFFPFHQDIRAGEGAFQDLGRLQIYRHRHPTSPSLNPPTY
jgi:hypothetical protein